MQRGLSKVPDGKENEVVVWYSTHEIVEIVTARLSSEAKANTRHLGYNFDGGTASGIGVRTAHKGEPRSEWVVVVDRW